MPEHKPKRSALARVWATRRHHRYSLHDLIDIRTRHPESNGIVERWNGTVRQESEDYYGDNYLVAQRKVQQLVDEYSNVRLHATLGYFERREFHFGNPSQRREDRAHKLLSASRGHPTAPYTAGTSWLAKRD